MNRSLLSAIMCLCFAVSTVGITGCKDEQSFNLYKKKKAPADKEKDKEKDKEEPPPELSKGCTIPAVQSVIRPHLDKVKRCYRKAVWKKPDLAGRLVVEINIDQSGRAKRLGVKEDTLNDHDVTRCIFKVLKSLAYPYPGRKSDICTVLYPFNFTAGIKNAPAKSD